MAHQIEEKFWKYLTGKIIKNVEDEYLGEVVELKNNKESMPEYIILKTSICHGEQDRFFAIPILSSIVKIKNEEVWLKIEKKDLQVAREIEACKLPATNSKFGLPIYELYEYSAPPDNV